MEVRIRVDHKDISLEELDLLWKAKKIKSYIPEGTDCRGWKFREIRIRYKPVGDEGKADMDFRPIINKVIRVVSVFCSLKLKGEGYDQPEERNE